MPTNTFEGGTNATNVTPSNSGGASGDAFNVLVANNVGLSGSGSTAIQYSSAAAIAGSMGCRMTLAAATTYIRWDVTASGTRFVMRRPFKVPSIPTTTQEIMSMRFAAGNACGVRIPTDGRPMLQYGTTVTESAASKPATALTAGSAWYWAELAVTVETGAGANGSVAFRILNAANVELHTYTISGLSNGTLPVTQYRFGGSNTTGGWTVDDVDSIVAQPLASGWIGALSATITPENAVYYVGKIDVTDTTVSAGTLTHSIAQVVGSGPTVAAIPGEANGIWYVVPDADLNLQYTVTHTASGGGSATQTVIVAPISGAFELLMNEGGVWVG